MITVVISSYKYGHLAAHCVESILSQSTKPKRILFVDDCAGDCSHIPVHYPEVEFFQNEENLGTVRNFQQMLEKVDTEYCMFIGADNWLRSDAIGMLYTTLGLEIPDIITYDMILTGELKKTRVSHHKDEVDRYQGDYYWTKKNSHHGSMLYRTELAKHVGGYSKIEHNFIHTCEDWSLWNKMTAAGAKVSYINEGLLYYRHHRENFNRY
jgi:glycosyltransferase involved in cell wall biosynthesis